MNKYQQKYYDKNKEEVIKKSTEYNKRMTNTLFRRTTDRINTIKYTAKKKGYAPVTDSRARVMAYMATQTECCHCGVEGPLDIDHCHETGKVRGMLCRKCNSKDVLK